MAKLIDEIGNRYGALVVVARAGSTVSYKAQWLCQCDCGNTTVAVGNNLRMGHRKSCGCGIHKKKSAAVVALNNLYAGYRCSARTRGLAWALTRNQFRLLTQQACHYCGVAPYQAQGYMQDFVYNGLDRMDNDGGYTLENTVACCGQCNRAKMDYSLEEFCYWAYRLYHHLADSGMLNMPIE